VLDTSKGQTYQAIWTPTARALGTWGIMKIWDVISQRFARPSSLYMGDKTVIARLDLGGYIYLDTDDLSITPGVALTGRWEHGITSLFRRRLQRGMRVVDIGANCGVYSVLAARGVGRTGFVTSVEPNPRLASLLRKSLIVNGAHETSRVIQGAVMDAEGLVTLAAPSALTGSASILIDAGEDHCVFTAEGRPLDAWLGEDQHVDVIKIDAEGAEPLIWDGAARVLERNRALEIFMEFSPPMLQRIRAPADFLQQIRSQGFTIHTIELATGRLAPARDDDLVSRSWAELLLTRR
jgi:FkbM family methyltransferase